MRRLITQTAWIVGVGLLYFAAGRFGLHVAATVNPSASAVWPATGLAIAASVLLGPSVWPVIFIAAFCFNVTTDAGPLASLLIATGNTLEAAVASILMQRVTGGRHTFDDAGRLLQFVFLVAIPCCMISASCGLVALLEDGSAAYTHAAAIWFTWWLGDVVGAVVVTPMILVWSNSMPEFRRRHLKLEAVTLIVAAVAIALFVYGSPILDRAAQRPLAFLILPIFVWGAYRFHQHGATALALVFGVIGVAGTLHGLGPFANAADNASILLMQSYLAIATVTALVLGASLSEHRRAQLDRDELLHRERLARDEERSARDEAERANRAKDQFIAVLSHELRTPLTPVLLTIAALEEDPSLAAEIREQLAIVRRNVELEARLIDDLLDLTRVARGKLQLRLAPHDLHDIILSAVRVCGEDRNDPQNGRVRTELRLDAEHHHVSADPGRMQQVFWNLLSNARKFTPPDGRITVTTSNNDSDAILVKVTDTGVGILPEMLPRLFNAFEQGQAGQTVRRSGLGLGLAISKALVMAHGGRIEARSDGPGCGATFTVTLPTVVPAEPERAHGPNDDQVTSPRRILLVEDDRPTLVVLRRLLESRRHHVTPADCVSAALAAASSSSFDLVISDLGLPDGTGDDLMRQLKSRFGLKGIALSGFGMESDVRRSLDAGFEEHLTKPIDLTALESAMTRVLTA